MSARYPGIWVQVEGTPVLVRSGFVLRFFVHRTHPEFAPGVVRAMDTFMRAVGPQTLAWYPDLQGDWQHLDAPAWERTRQALLDGGPHASVTLVDQVEEDKDVGFLFEYQGISLEEPGLLDDPRRACVATFWMSTEFLEQRGPERIRELALELSSHLPFDSGYASLAFLAPVAQPLNLIRALNRLCFRYPGMDILKNRVAWDIGTRIPGAYWLTFLGPSVLSALGGEEELRARLSSPDTTVRSLRAERAVVTLGQWPEAGDLEAGKNLPAYRELARVLEPWLYHRGPNAPHDSDFPPDDWLRWERRFLD